MKRDISSQDHTPLFEAEQGNDYTDLSIMGNVGISGLNSYCQLKKSMHFPLPERKNSANLIHKPFAYEKTTFTK
jgi:hypothetical protein